MVRRMYKSFIIGCGRIAGYSNDGFVNDFTHGYAYRKNPYIELVGCMDINPEKRQLFSENFNCIAFDDFQDGIIKTGSEIVSVCTPDDTHYKVVKSLLEMDSNIRVVFLEKPACSTLDEMDHLIALSAEKSIDIVVNHTRRFDNRYKEIRKNIADGKYGDLVTGFITYYSGWQHNGVHIIDTLSYLFDDSVEFETIQNGANSPYQDDPTIEGKLFLSKLPGEFLLMSFDEKYYQLFEFDLRFEKARLRIEDFGKRIILEVKEVNNIGENVLVMRKNSFEKNVDAPIKTAVELIISRLRTNDPNLLKGFLLKDVSNPMKTIWKGLELYAN